MKFYHAVVAILVVSGFQYGSFAQVNTHRACGDLHDPIALPQQTPPLFEAVERTPIVYINSRGLQIVRAADEGAIDSNAPRHFRVQLVSNEFPSYDLSRGSISLLTAGQPSEGDQGGIRFEHRALSAHPVRIDADHIGWYVSRDGWQSSLRWPRRYILWSQRERWGFLPDIARLTLVAPPTDSEWVRRLKSAGVLGASDTLEDLQLRLDDEQPLSDEGREWLNDVAGAVERHRAALLSASAASHASTHLEERVGRLHAAVLDANTALVRAHEAHPGDRLELPLRRITQLRKLTREVLNMEGVTEGRLAKLREAAETLLEVRAYIRRSDRLPQYPDWSVFRERACPYARTGPVASFDVMEDELFPALEARHPRVVEFDYDVGYVARSDDAFYVNEGDHLFVRVHGVPPDQPVSVLWNETVVTTTRAERGLDGMPAPPTGADAGAGDQRNVVVAPRSTAEPRSALLLRVGQVRSGRYAFSVCRSGTTAADCQRSGHHSLTVQGERWWGFRAGLGLDLRWARNSQYQADRIGTSDVYRITRSDDLSLRGAIPFSMVLYLPPYHRQLHRNQFEWGFATGVDLLRPTRRFHAGLHLGGGPIGVLIAATLTRRNVPNVGSTTILESEVAPNLRTIFGSNREFAPGVMLALTFDFDVFKRIFEAIIFKGFPGIGGGTGSQ